MALLLDCRWLGSGGVGRVTEHLVTAWQESPPKGDWLLWGPPQLEKYLWPGARLHVDSLTRPRHPLSILPRHDGALFMHQLHRGTRQPSVVFIHDTIPVRYGGRATVRYMKREYLRRVARSASHIVAPSDFSRRSIVSDLGVEPGKVTVIQVPVAADWLDMVRVSREIDQGDPFILYVGRYAAHKNVERLVEAFGRTRFRGNGGRLVLAGGTAKQSRELLRAIVSAGLNGQVEVHGEITQTHLECLYRRTSLLVTPSLEEGFGLPAREALTAGVPVAVSRGGALLDLAEQGVPSFDPQDVSEMVAVLDRQLADEGGGEIRRQKWTRLDFGRAMAVTVGQFLLGGVQ